MINKKQNEKEMFILLTSIEILPSETAKVLRLHYDSKLSLKEICMVMNKSISTVRNHHNRGIFLLKKYHRENKAKLIS